jgi:hypothetical protein
MIGKLLKVAVDTVALPFSVAEDVLTGGEARSTETNLHHLAHDVGDLINDPFGFDDDDVW